MIRIDVLDKIADNLEIFGYGVEKTRQVFIYRKENNRFDVDLDVKEIRFYTKTKQWSLQKSFTLDGFLNASTDWIKQHKLLKYQNSSYVSIRRNEMDRLNEAIDFFESDDLEELFDHIQDDLKFECDFELTKIFDMVADKNIDVSLEDIIKATIKRVVLALETFKD